MKAQDFFLHKTDIIAYEASCNDWLCRSIEDGLSKETAGDITGLQYKLILWVFSWCGL